MNPELRDTHDNAALNGWVTAEQAKVDQARSRYTHAQHGTGSWWGNIKGAINDLRDGHRPGHELREAKRDYIETRDTLIRTKARVAVNSNPAALANDDLYKKTLADHVASLTVAEMKQLSGAGIDLNKQSKAGERVRKVTNNKWVRFGVGWGLNIGIGMTMAAGLLPVSIGLTAARVGLGAAGIEPLLRRSTDEFSHRRGARSEQNIDPNAPLERRLEQSEAALASWHAYRVRERMPASQAVAREDALYTTYNSLLAEHVKVKLDADNIASHNGTTPPAPNIAGSLVDSLKDAMAARTDRALYHREWGMRNERHNSVFRWAGALAISGIVTGFLTPATQEISFNSPDQYFASEIGNGNVSSLHGWAQAQVATNEMGIQNFDPYNTEHTSQFWKEWTSNLPFYESKAASLENWVRINNPHAIVPSSRFGDIYGSDLLRHDFGISAPKDTNNFLNNVIMPPEFTRNWQLPFEIPHPIFRNPLPVFGGDNWGINWRDRMPWSLWPSKRPWLAGAV